MKSASQRGRDTSLEFRLVEVRATHLYREEIAVGSLGDVAKLTVHGFGETGVHVTPVVPVKEQEIEVS